MQNWLLAFPVDCGQLKWHRFMFANQCARHPAAPNEGTPSATKKPESNQNYMTHDPTTTQKPATVLIVDDHPLVCEGLALQIGRHRDLSVCGQAESVDEAMALVKSLRPDLVIVDLTLKNSSGLELLKQVKAWDDKICLVVLSAHDEAHYAQRALCAGATGYINKHEMPEFIISAIRKVLAGEVFLGPQAAGLLRTARPAMARRWITRLRACCPIASWKSSG